MSALLQLDHVSVRLGARAVLSDVSLALERGEIVALLGPNGAGKTTLMRAAIGIVPLAAGAAKLGDAEAHTLTSRERALRAAYLPQRPQTIWPISVEALVALGRFAHGAAPDRLSKQDQAAVDESIRACDLNALRSRRMDEISGGEKARAHLARALAQHAPLLVLDEPTAGLDPAQALGVAGVLKAHVAKEGGVLISTHDVALAARMAGRVLLLRDGAALALGTPREALTSETLRAAYGRSARIEQIGGQAVALFE